MGSCRTDRDGCTLRVARGVRYVLRRRLKLTNVLDFLIAAGNSFKMVGAGKLKLKKLQLYSIRCDVAASHIWEGGKGFLVGTRTDTNLGKGQLLMLLCISL